MLTPAFLDELLAFDTAQKRRVSALFQGEQVSPFVGEGQTFSDFRRYVPGDDTRRIDWKLYGRSDELFVRRYEAERSLTLHVLLDASASMDFGDGEAHKFEYGAKLGLGFAFLTALEHDDVRVSVIVDGFDRLDDGRSNRGTVLSLVDDLNAVDPAGETDFASSLVEYAATIGSRSLVLVVSDFLADPAAVEAGFDALAANRLLLAQVLSPAELDPPVRGEAVFTDPEAETSLRTYYGGRRQAEYRERLDTHVAAVAAVARARGGRHVLVDTGDDFFESFARTWVEP